VRQVEVLFVSLMSEDVNPSYRQHLQNAAVPLHTLDAQRDWRDVFILAKVARLAKQYDIDIVHSFLIHANFLARFSRLLYPRPRQISSARSIIEGGRLREWGYRLSDPLCHLTTQNSQSGADRYVRIQAVPAHKMRVLLNVVDTTLFRPDPPTRSAMRQALGLDDDFVWLAVGRLVPVKNYPLLLTAFSRLYAEDSRLRLLVVGDGPEQESLQCMAEGLNITAGLHFLGTRHDVAAVMNATDAYVMTSNWEGTSNVLIEASATALPIVATRVGGNAEVVVDGRSGYLVAAQQIDELYSRMRQMMALTSDERQQMGQAARQHIEAQYGIDRNIRRVFELYDEVLKRSPTAADR
jgi:glycosyltransferase involved in cell wall biosynthesis